MKAALNNFFFSVVLTLTTSACGSKFKVAATSSPVIIMSLDKIQVEPSTTLLVKGQNLSKSVSAKVEDVPVDLVLNSESEASLTLPSTLKTGVNSIQFYKATTELASFSVYHGDDLNELAVIDMDQNKICEDVIFQNALKQVVRGSRKCHSKVDLCDKDGQKNCITHSKIPSVDKNGLESKVIASSVVGGVIGVVPGKPADCSADGDTDCYLATSAFVAAHSENLKPTDIRLGKTLAGVQGAVSLINCTTDGEVGCITTASYPSIDKSSLDTNASKFLSTVTIAGVSGTLDNCSTDGQTGCRADGTQTVSAIVAGAASKILMGESVAGVNGTAPLKPLNCSTDGGVDCIAIPTFPAVNKTNLTAAATSIRTSLTIAGINGNLLDCANEGQTSCHAVALFPAVDKFSLSSHAGKIRTGFTLASVAGTLNDCATDGADQCVAVSSFPALDKLLAPSKILSGQTLGGVAGTAATRPLDCASEGGIGCVTTSNFPAMNTATAASKIISGQTLAGVSGTAPLRPSNCSSENEISCVAAGNFPAVKKADVQSNTNKVSVALTVVGISGTLPDCSSDGDDSCLALGPSFAAASLSGADSKIQMGQTLAGVGGSDPVRPADCSTDGQSTCVATNAFPAMNTAAAPLKIVLGQVVGGVTGTAPDVRPSDCSVDGETSCVTTSSFRAMDASTAAAKIALGDSLGGVTGAASAQPSDCSTDGAINCVTVPSFPAADKANLTTHSNKIISSLTLLGVTGSINECSAEGLTSCLAVAAYPSVDKSTIAAKVLATETVAGVQGQFPVRLLDCAADGATACVTVANFPAVDSLALANHANKFRAPLSLANVTGTLSDCSADGAVSCTAVTEYPAADKSVAAPRIVTGSTLAGVAGTGVGRPADCSSDGALGCTAVTNFPAINKTVLTNSAPQIRSATTIATIQGSLGDCTSDGQVNCFATGSFAAANTTGAAAKVLTGQTVAGAAGSAAVTPAVCSTDNSTSCVSNTAFPAISKSSITASQGSIRASLSLAGVSGLLADCTSDGQTNCFTVSDFPAALTTGADLKILTGQTVAGVPGVASLKPSDCVADGIAGCTTVANYPSVSKSALQTNSSSYSNSLTFGSVTGTLADCSMDNGVGCQAVTNFPAIIKANVTAGKIKAGSTIAGVLGVYPNASHPLPVVDGHAELDGTTFNAKMASSATFAYFDRNGTRHTNTGDANLVSSKVNLGTNIFGVMGEVIPSTANCTADGQSNCVSTSTFKAIDSTGLTSWDVKVGTTYAGTNGTWTPYQNTADLTRYNRTTGSGASASTTLSDYYDTLDDWNAGGIVPPTGIGAAPGTNWIMDLSADNGAGGGTAGNGNCEGTEACIFTDLLTRNSWYYSNTAVTWENAISACDSLSAGGYTDWRLSTQKEAMQFYINGSRAVSITGKLGTPVSYDMWTSTTYSVTPTQAYAVNTGDGWGSPKDKSSLYPKACVRKSNHFEVNKIYQISNVATSKCLNVSTNSTANGAAIIQYQCSEAYNDHFRLKQNADSSYSLQGLYSNKCIDVSGGATANRSLIVQNTCTGATSQKVSFTLRADGAYTITFAHANKCLDLPFGDSANNVQLEINDCVGNLNQGWSISR